MWPPGLFSAVPLYVEVFLPLLMARFRGRSTGFRLPIFTT